MKRNYLSITIVAVLTLIIVIGSAIHAPAVEAANRSSKSTVSANSMDNTHETVNSSLETNAVIDEEEIKIAKTRAMLIDAAKKEAQSSVREQEELIEKKKAEEEMSIDYYSEDNDSSSSASSSSSKKSDTSSKATSSYEYNDDEDTQSSGSTYVAESTNAGFLININNPDPNYKSYSVSLSDADRSAAERIIMGEAGSMGYNGMALVAQCLRDAYITNGYSSISETISSYGYYASMSKTPSQTCKEAVKYIFDQGGAAVQHRILVFYASDYCSSSWHESQNYIVSCGNVRFFDTW